MQRSVQNLRCTIYFPSKKNRSLPLVKVLVIKKSMSKKSLRTHMVLRVQIIEENTAGGSFNNFNKFVLVM